MRDSRDQSALVGAWPLGRLASASLTSASEMPTR